MLISARDLVLRLPEPDERIVRAGLSGNLCRCTGYVGIVRAVRAVIDQRRKRGIAPVAGGGRQALGPAGSGNATNSARSDGAARTAARDETRDQIIGVDAIPDFTPTRVFSDHFTVPFPPNRVFDMLGDVRQVAACLPGASLTGEPTPERVEGAIRVKLGPISADFRGAARIERDLENLSGRIVGMGIDKRSRSSTQGEIRYRLLPAEQGTATRVELSIGYSLKGILAQIARDGLVRDVATRLTADFALNLGRHLAGDRLSGTTQAPQELNAVSLLIGLLRARVHKSVRRLLGRQQ
jgi:carbon-monoxide dehydrogenase small subunit